MGTFLGLDVGTSAAKALLVDETGAVRARGTASYPLHTPHPNWSEQHPDDWWAGTVAAIRAALEHAPADAREVDAIGLTGQMHGLVLRDSDGAVVRPAILWNDQRTAAQCAAIHERAGYERTIAITGKPALTGFTAPKVLWVREHEPEAFARAAHLHLPKDDVRYRMSGAHAIDVADASGTGFFSCADRHWSDEMIDALEIPRAWLPSVHESPEICATLNADGAAALGLREGTPIVAGAGDQAAEAVGCGIVRPGAVSVTIGTSGVVFAATTEPTTDAGGRLHTYCHAIPGRWHMMGVMLSAGGSLRWYRDTFEPDAMADAAARGMDAYDIILERAFATPPGSEGVTFLPYLTGERTPYADPDARGAFLGLSLRASRAHLARAVVEGITFGLRDALELVHECGLPITALRTSGGGARSAAWRQLMADVFQHPIATVTAIEGAAYGAALLAGVGAGAWRSVEEAADTCVHDSTRVEPSGVSYDEAYARYGAFARTARTCPHDDGQPSIGT